MVVVVAVGEINAETGGFSRADAVFLFVCPFADEMLSWREPARGQSKQRGCVRIDQ